MTKEQELLARWQSEKATYGTWGAHVRDTIIGRLIPDIAPVPVSYFLKTGIEPRTKDDLKLVEKAFFRSKPYEDPYDEITDKVGIRFVVLLGTDIHKVVTAVESISDWTASKDRDYEEEQNKNPVAFEYAAVHFVVRPKAHLIVGSTSIAAGTPCEVQIKTLLQHAYSELTHDTIYKPQIEATPIMRRNAAKAMALLEATNDYFESVARDVNAALAAVREVTRKLSVAYKQITGLDARPGLLEGLLLEAYEPAQADDYMHALSQMIEKRPYVADRIRERVAEKNPIFAQPSVLLAYLAVDRSLRNARRLWPLTPSEIEPILNDLGESLQ